MPIYSAPLAPVFRNLQANIRHCGFSTEALKHLGHGKRLRLINEPNHPALGVSRDYLANLRLNVDQQARLSVIKNAKKIDFQPKIDLMRGLPPMLELNGKEVAVASLSDKEVTSSLLDPNRIVELGEGVALTLAEFRVVQHYISREDFSWGLNQFLRGETIRGDERLTDQEWKEMALLLVSALNALPIKQGPGVHTINSESAMFEAMLRAGEEKKPFIADSFISMTTKYEFDQSDDLPTPLYEFGDTPIAIYSNLAREVSGFCDLFAHEREKTVPPYESFDVEIHKWPVGDEPVISLKSRVKL